MGQPKIITGANLILYVNSKPFGRVHQFAYNPSTPIEEIGEIDNIEPVELATTTSRCSWSMSLYRTKGDGGIEGPGIQPVAVELPRGKYFSLLLLERVTDTIVFRADFCKVDNQSWQAAARQFVQGTVTGKAISWSNEVRPRGA